MAISKQMITGKAFEYALLIQFFEKLEKATQVEIVKNSAVQIAKDCFKQIDLHKQNEYLLAASFSINFLLDIEPRLSHDLGKEDILQLEILSDQHGQSGDVRDVIAIRALQKWEIGVSAKHNHQAVKHSRLSSKIDFGEKWFGIKVSDSYFTNIKPIFENLRVIRENSNRTIKWSEIGDYHTNVYAPVLQAFMTEIKRLNQVYPQQIASKLVSYLVGNRDFYKVIKIRNCVEIHAYNLNGTLNLPFQDILPKYQTPQILLPTEILDISFKANSQNTVIMTFNNNWKMSFRIHNASSRVEPSLKFDINLLESPKSLYKNTLNLINLS